MNKEKQKSKRLYALDTLAGRYTKYLRNKAQKEDIRSCLKKQELKIKTARLLRKWAETDVNAPWELIKLTELALGIANFEKIPNSLPLPQFVSRADDTYGISASTKTKNKRLQAISAISKKFEHLPFDRPLTNEDQIIIRTIRKEFDIDPKTMRGWLRLNAKGHKFRDECNEAWEKYRFQPKHGAQKESAPKGLKDIVLEACNKPHS